MLRADMMKDAGNCATDTGIETSDRIDMNGVSNVVAAGMLHGVMTGIVPAKGYERCRLYHSSSRHEVRSAFQRRAPLHVAKERRTQVRRLVRKSIRPCVGALVRSGNHEP